MPPQQGKCLLDLGDIAFGVGAQDNSPREPLDMVREFGLVKVGGF